MPRLTHLLTVLIFAGLLSGCDQSTTDQQTQTFADAAQELITLRNTIRDGFAANDIDAAHGPLHEVGHVLEKLETLAEADHVTPDDATAMKSATEALFDAFGAVDKTLHGGDGSTYEEEAAKIDANIKIVADLAGIEDVSSPNQDATGNMAPADSVQPMDTLEPMNAIAPVDSIAPEEVPAPAPPAN